jgi:hypothetical protein
MQKTLLRKGPSIKDVTTFSRFFDPSLPHVLDRPQFSDPPKKDVTISQILPPPPSHKTIKVRKDFFFQIRKLSINGEKWREIHKKY